MSSTSSSASLSDGYCHCGNEMEPFARSFPTARTPMYTTIRNPLIYYAQVQHQPMTRRQSNRESRKGNRNCFVKAFQWYTQDHGQPQNKASPDISGFAEWLDTKYGEYLRESQVRQPSPLQLRQPTTPDANNASALCDTCATKTKMRCRSPWSKRKRTSKEAGDARKKMSEKFEFIMRPQPASECCCTPPASIYNKSTATVSSDAEGNTKIKVRSQSLSKVGLNAENAVKQDGEKLIEKASETKLMKVILPDDGGSKFVIKQKEIEKVTGDINEPKQTGSTEEVSCQCPEFGVIHENVHTQYDTKLEASGSNLTAGQMKYNPSLKNYTKQPKPLTRNNLRKRQQRDVITKPQKNVRVLDSLCQCSKESIHKVDVVCQCQYEFGSYDNDSQPCACDREIRTSTGSGRLTLKNEKGYYVKNIANIEACRSTAFMSGVAQTSDHSICLERQPIRGYPLFLRIVRADKPN